MSHARRQPDRHGGAGPAAEPRPDDANRAVQRSTVPGVHDSERMRVQRDLHARLMGPAVTQRTIHEWADDAWRVKELGTRGKHPLPDNGEAGRFFNDITGRQSDDFEAVRAGLIDRMMQAGGLADLGKQDDELVGSWLGLSAKLALHSQAKLQPLDIQKKAVQDRMASLGFLYLSEDLGHQLLPCRRPNGDVAPDLFLEASLFVIRLMEANGQLQYIRQKGWLSGGRHVCIDINYYYNRPMGDSGTLGMHKDTGGDNLFVNLVFDNKEETPATEWTQDREPIVGEKLRVMKETHEVPDEMLEAIQQAKTGLGEDGTRAKGKERIKGGVMPKLAYLSWVDELAWHATPTLAKRKKYIAGNRYSALLRKILRKEAHAADDDDVADILEVFAALDEREDSLLRPKNFPALHLVDDLVSLNAWIDVNIGSQRLDLLPEIDRLEQAGTVKTTGRIGNDLDSDDDKQLVRLIKPTKVANRPRSNSKDGKLAAVKEAAARQTLRSFIRTWVRILKGPAPHD